MTDAPTPVVLDEDQGSSAARIPTEGVTASGDELASPALAAQSDEDRFYAIKGLIARAMQDERDGKPCGCIIAAGCEARDYHDPEYAANGFIWQAAVEVCRYLEAKPVENSPSPALGGDGAKRSEQKDHPTPVGGLGPVAWRSCIIGHDEYEWEYTRFDPQCDTTDFEVVDPLYSSSTVSAQQAEIERLREALKEARSDIIGYVSARGSEYEGSPEDAVAFIDQALGGSHD